MNDIEFVTERLVARRWVASDVDALLVIYGDAESMRWVGDGAPLPLAECRRWIDVTLANYRSRGYGMLALVEQATGEIVGCCGIVHPGGQPEPEAKYAFRRADWGRGLATEALGALVDHAWRRHGLTRVTATAAPENEASHRVLMKTGFRRTALRTNGDGSLTQCFEWRAGRAGE